MSEFLLVEAKIEKVILVQCAILFKKESLRFKRIPLPKLSEIEQRIAIVWVQIIVRYVLAVGLNPLS